MPSRPLGNSRPETGGAVRAAREGPTVVCSEFDIRTDAPPDAIRAALLDFTNAQRTAFGTGNELI